MKDKLKILKDTRYFEIYEVYGSGVPLSYGGKCKISLPKGIQSIGQRISCMLYLNGYMLSTYDHLYITFAESIPEGDTIDTKFGSESWHRYVICGVSKNFKKLSDSEKCLLYNKPHSTH